MFYLRIKYTNTHIYRRKKDTHTKQTYTAAADDLNINQRIIIIKKRVSSSSTVF
jgi:predicted amidophosphoribosyltransferase